MAKIFSVVAATYTPTPTHTHTDRHLCIAHTYLNVVSPYPDAATKPNQNKPKLTKLNQSNMRVKSIFEDTLHALRSGLRYFSV